MVEIIPTILEKDVSGVLKRLSQARAISQRVQIDVLDGKFVPNKTFFTPEEIASSDIDSELELHLMVKDPAKEIPRWSNIKSVKRIYFHQEAGGNIQVLIDLVKNSGKEVGLAISPSTHPKTLFRYLANIDDVLFMGVCPGFSGQQFKQEVLLHIRTLRNFAPYLSISLDGGVDDASAPLIARAGANRLVASSYLFSAKNISRAKRILEILCS